MLLFMRNSPVASLGGRSPMPLLLNTVLLFQDRFPKASQQTVVLCLQMRQVPHK